MGSLLAGRILCCEGKSVVLRRIWRWTGFSPNTVQLRHQFSIRHFHFSIFNAVASDEQHGKLKNGNCKLKIVGLRALTEPYCV